MCDQNALFRMFAAAQQHQEQQQRAVAAMSAFNSASTSSASSLNGSSSATAIAQINALAAAAAATMTTNNRNSANALAAANMTPEMALWQTILQAQMIQQMQQPQQPSFDDVLKALMEPSKNGSLATNQQKGHARQEKSAAKPAERAMSTTAVTQLAQRIGIATATTSASTAVTSKNNCKAPTTLEPGEVVRREKDNKAKAAAAAAVNAAAMRKMIDTAMWQLLAAQMVQSQAQTGFKLNNSQPTATTSAKTTTVRANGQTKRTKKEAPFTTTTSAELSMSTSRGGSATPSESGCEGSSTHRKRPPATEAQARVALDRGWRRQTCVRTVASSGVRGDVLYYAPCGKKLSTYAEVIRYLLKNNITDVLRENFSFSSRLVVGEFVAQKPSEDGGDPELVQLTEADIREQLTKAMSDKQQAKIAAAAAAAALVPSAATSSPSTTSHYVAHEKKDKNVEPKATIEKVNGKEKEEKAPVIPALPEEVLENLNDDMDDSTVGCSGAHEDGKVGEKSREPMDDLLLAETRSLPEMKRISNMCLDANGFADALMVHEFVQNFAHVLDIDLKKVPKLEKLCAGLAGDKRYASDVLSLTHTLFQLTLEYPGLPNGRRGRTKFGQGVGELGLNRNNYSELMRMFLASRDTQGKQLATLLEKSSFETISGEQKAAILAYLCNELLGCQNIVKEIDGNLEEIGRLKGEKWMREGKARTLRTMQKRKRRLTAKDDDDERANEGSDSDTSRPPSPANQKRFTPGLGQCEILTAEEESLTIEEMESLVSELLVEAKQLREKIHDYTIRVRSFPFGWDRFHRQYWLLAHTPAVLVESIESAAPHNPACNVTEICSRDPACLITDDRHFDPDVLGCLEDIVDEVILIRAQADKKQRKRYRRIDNSAKRGWWTLENKDVLEQLKTSLHGRGIRERCLHRLLCKSWFINDIKLGSICLEPVKELVDVANVEKANRLRLALSIEKLRQRIVTSNVGEKKCTKMNARGLALSDASWTYEDVNKFDDVLDEQLRQRILQTETMIDAPYFRPSFRIGDIGVVHDVAEDVSSDGEEKLLVDDDAADDDRKRSLDPKDANLSLSQQWRRFVSQEAKTTAQLATALQMLEGSIAWERSPKEALCQICKSPDGDEMLLCDGCETGYHMECFRPPLKSVPDGDWFCPHCRQQRSGKPMCVLCCSTKKPLIACQRCSNAFHLDCAQDQLDGPAAEYVCPHCVEIKNQNFERRTIMRGESEERLDPDDSELDGAVKLEKRSTKRKGDPIPLSLPAEMNAELCRSMLDELEGQPGVAPFMEPVDLKAVVGYRDLIPNPMDLQTIRGRIDSLFYDSPDEFAVDVDMMFSNCRTFNEDNSPVGTAGIVLCKFFHKRWRQLKYNFSKRLKRMRIH